MEILLIGAGNLGKRYLESLITLPKKKLNIYVTDLDHEQLDKIKFSFSRYIDKKIHIFNNYKKIPKNIDFCIICTTSTTRHLVVEQILKIKKIKFWILEKLVSNKIENLIKIKQLLNNQLAYVNLPRSYDTKYLFLKKKKLKNINITTTGGNWNLASNALHHLYLLSWLVNEKISCINFYPKKIYKSKRPGYSDFYGKVTAKTISGSTINLTNNETRRKFITTIKSKKIYWLINEHSGTLIKDRSNVIVNSFNFQSEITSKIITDIAKKKKNIRMLPTLKDIFDLHLIFLKKLKNIKLIKVT